MSDLAFAGLARQAQLIRDGEVTSRELVELSLERIERFDPQLNAFGAVYAEQALQQADTPRPGPLSGVPIAVKDEMDIGGEITSRGTGAIDAPAVQDSEVVRRLREAGAVVVGKTKMPELGLWPFTESITWGVTRNPWDPDRTPGGSSGGSAAAVAAGLVPAAVAADGAGSIRIPAACCGLFGLKPQYGPRPARAARRGREPLDLLRRPHAVGRGLDPDARRDGARHRAARAQAAARSPSRRSSRPARAGSSRARRTGRCTTPRNCSRASATRSSNATPTSGPGTCPCSSP